jgi:hypothetical protein
MIREMLEEWENCIVIPTYKEGKKPKVENYRVNSLLNACYKLCSKILNKKIESTSRKVPFDIPEWTPKRQVLHRSIVKYEITYR